MGDKSRWLRKVKVLLETNDGQTILSGKKIQLIDRIDGDQSVKVSWLIKGKGSVKIIAGAQKATIGGVRCPKDTVIAYLPQHLLTEDNCTVFEETSKAFAGILAMRDEIDSLNKALETRTDYESDEYMSIIEKVSDLGEKFYALEDINYDAEVEKALKGLGFKQEDFTKLTKEFSGGWRMRIELAKILLQKPDLILLDEPTNHIDIESVIWLEDFLVNKANAVVVISHD